MRVFEYSLFTLFTTICEGVPVVRGEQFLRHTTVVAGPPLDTHVKVVDPASYIKLVTDGSPVCVCVCVCEKIKCYIAFNCMYLGV